MKNKKEIDMIMEEIEKFSDKASDLFDNDDMSSEEYGEKFDKLTKNIATSILSKLKENEIVLAKGKVVAHTDESHFMWFDIGDTNWGTVKDEIRELENQNIILTAKVVKDE